MVDFSDRNGIRRWLDGIEPAERRREAAIALAARAVLRVAPLLVTQLKAGINRPAVVLAEIVLPSLRATALPWVAAKYPAHGNELRAAARAAAFAAAYPAAAFAAYPATAAARAAYAAAAEAADTAAFAADAADAARYAAYAAAAEAADTARYAAYAAAAEAADTAAFAADADAADAARYAAYAADAAFIDSGRSAAELAGLPLWADGAPDWVAEIWRSLRRALLATNDGWEVWTEWYEARLAGDMAQPPNEALEIARATIADEIWKQGPTVVNAEIKRLIEEHKGPPPETGEADANDGSLEDQSGFDPILATRAVLRVLPLLATDERIGDRVKSKFVLSVFHALAVAWTRTVFPDLVSPDLSLAAARDISPVAPTTRSAALHIGQAATHAANSAGSRDRGAAASHKRAGDLQIRQSLRALTNPILFEGVVAQATTHDTEICFGFTPKQIGAIALWPGGVRRGYFFSNGIT